MKKKLALLLVLTMVLSAIPMNLFGAPTSPGRVDPVITERMGAIQHVTVNLDLMNFVGQELAAPGIGLRVEITGGDDAVLIDGPASFAKWNNNFGAFPAYSDFRGFTSTLIRGGDMNWTWGDWGAGTEGNNPEDGWDPNGWPNQPWGTASGMKSAFVSLAFRDNFNGDIITRIPSHYSMTAGMAGTPIVSGAAINWNQTSIPLRFWVAATENANIVVKWAHNDHIIFNSPVASLPGTGITIGNGARVNFHSAVCINEITLTENRRGAIFQNNFTVRLEGPRYYKWHLGTIQGQDALRSNIAQRDNQTVFNGLNRNLVLDNNTWIRPTDDGLGEILFIRMDASNRVTQGALALITAQIRLRNLWLVAEDRAPMNRAVEIITSVGTSTGTGAGAVFTYMYDNWQNEQNTKTLEVAYRTTNEMTFALAGGARDVRTGTLGRDYPTNKRTWLRTSGNVAADPFWEGVRTQTVILKESSPNAWGSNFSTPTEFRFDHQGIRILGAQVWIPGPESWHSRDFYVDSNSNTRYWFEGWMNKETGLYPTDPGAVTLSADSLKVYYPTQNVSDVRWQRELRVTFYLSVEAGYEHKYGPDIDVTVSGTGVGNLSADSRTLTVANAVDPIAVEISGGAVEVPVGTTYFTGKVDINDITIIESETFRLDVGQELWVYVIGDGRRQDVTFTSDDVVRIDTDSGLRMRRGYRLHHPVANYWLDGMGFVVERESWSTAPASFTLTNCAISGNIYPNVEYKVIVSGRAIAENDQMVIAAYRNISGLATAAEINRLTVGAFFAAPYPVTAVTFSERVADDGAPDPGIGGPGFGFVSPASLGTLFGGDFIYRPNTTGSVKNVGYVPVAKFRDLLIAAYGADNVSAVWDGGTSTVTMIAPNKQGEVTTVELKVDSNQFTVNGVPYDIADYTHNASGPSRTITALGFDGATYLPLRALARAFGWTVEIVGSDIIVR